MIKLFLLSSEFEKYFLYKVRYNIEENINKIIKNPTKPVSVKFLNSNYVGAYCI